MRTKCFIVLLSILFSNLLDAQTELILQPNAAAGKDAHIAMSTNGYDGGGGTAKTLFNSAWTQSGVPFTHRSMVEFDLSQIPETATIVDAKLSLYAYDGPEKHSQRDGSNACWIERITSDWDEDGVKWSNQPSTTAANRIEIPGTSDVTQDYELDVKDLVQDMVKDPANSFGFFIKLQTESYYRSMIFCTSDYAEATKHPKLVITYEDGGTDNNLGVLEVEVTNRTQNSACLEWEAIPNAVNYELQGRQKGTETDWENTVIKTQKTKIYFYSPIGKDAEYRVITYYENSDVIVSDIFELPAFFVGSN